MRVRPVYRLNEDQEHLYSSKGETIWVCPNMEHIWAYQIYHDIAIHGGKQPKPPQPLGLWLSKLPSLPVSPTTFWDFRSPKIWDAGIRHVHNQIIRWIRGHNAPSWQILSQSVELQKKLPVGHITAPCTLFAAGTPTLVPNSWTSFVHLAKVWWSGFLGGQTLHEVPAAFPSSEVPFPQPAERTLLKVAHVPLETCWFHLYIYIYVYTCIFNWYIYIHIYIQLIYIIYIYM